eukprot:Plantae.Rhodophyta-Hildenbrandia_rubra.ctg1843.p1 GENE.Plantae.Rhodophyta-Hildenbrandia_rubra.ctg1843~~Plantae.Rhodophyta-Hildenbrandia_rubra.ctg1843.p1  ORF type:complete len:760 (-),score=109.47 Plantae.Rhodophyta-Hildenbrandia_rubra.ctg1843:6561-8810(-)
MPSTSTIAPGSDSRTNGSMGDISTGALQSVQFGISGRHRPQSNNEADIKQELQRIQEDIAITQRKMFLLRNDPTNFAQKGAFDNGADRYGRVMKDMPESIQRLYAEGNWKDKPVYLWDFNMGLIEQGHQTAAKSGTTLESACNPASSGFEYLRAENHPAVQQALRVGRGYYDAIKAGILQKRIHRWEHSRKVKRRYMALKKDWLASMEEKAWKETEEQKIKRRERDRYLLIANRSGMKSGTHSSVFSNLESRVNGTTGRPPRLATLLGSVQLEQSLSLEQVNDIVRQIDTAGGTASGMSRWSKSLATIPEQNPGQIPPASDCGILIEDPLAEHYDSQNVNPWTIAERLLFLEKYSAYPKNFAKIAKFFQHKSTNDVVRFYYSNKLRLNLKNLVRDNQLRKKVGKKSLLIALSRLPTESRSIRDNFAYQKVYEQGDMSSVTETETEEMKLVGREWSLLEKQRLVMACCKFLSDWNAISSFIESKTPNECRAFFSAFHSALQLSLFEPPGEPALDNLWKGGEIRKLRRLLRSEGRKWDLIARLMGTRTREECKDYWIANIRGKPMKLLNAIGLESDMSRRSASYLVPAHHYATDAERRVHPKYSMPQMGSLPMRRSLNASYAVQAEPPRKTHAPTWERAQVSPERIPRAHYDVAPVASHQQTNRATQIPMQATEAVNLKRAFDFAQNRARSGANSGVFASPRKANEVDAASISPSLPFVVQTTNALPAEKLQAQSFSADYEIDTNGLSRMS